MLRRIAILMVGGTLVAGCASASSTSGDQAAPAVTRRSANLITAAELNESSASNLYQAIQMLRPNWLRGRPRGSPGAGREEVVVYLDANRYGGAASLNSLSLGGIVEIRYMDASEATNRFGTGHTGGAIVIRMTKP